MAIITTTTIAFGSPNMNTGNAINLATYGLQAFGFYGESAKSISFQGSDVVVDSITNVAGQPPLVPFDPAHRIKLLPAALNGRDVFDFGQAVGVGLHTTLANNTQPNWTIFTLLNVNLYGPYGTAYLEIQQGNPTQTGFPWYRQATAGTIETQAMGTNALAGLNQWQLVVNYIENGVGAARVNKVGSNAGASPVPIPTGVVNINPGKMGYFDRSSNYEFDFRGQMALQWGYAGELSMLQIQEVEDAISVYYDLGL
jgi:hypothetical protein